MKEILINLQKIFQNINYIKQKSVKIGEYETDIESIPLSMYPAIVIIPGDIVTIKSDRGSFIVLGYQVEILIANHYLKKETILFGTEKIKGILELVEDIKKALSENPKLNNFCDGFLPSTFGIQAGFLPDVKRYTPARKISVTFKKIEILNSI